MKISSTRDRWGDLSINADTGSVTVRWIQHVQMSGHYNFSMILSREDLALLFMASMKDLPVEKVVQLLSESREVPPAANGPQTPPPA